MSFSNGKYDQASDLALQHVGQPSTPRMIAIHYTVTDDLRAAVNALNGAGLSYHFLIEPDGRVHQTRRPDRHAAHAGRSNWKQSAGVGNGSSLNRDAVSISFINRGFFAKGVNGFFFDQNAHGNQIGGSYPAAEVTRTTSVYDPGAPRNWHKYTEAQIAAVRRLVPALRDAFRLTELVGHDDIAIDGKSDPGPLFPMAALRQEFGLSGGLGLRTAVRSPDGRLTLRRRPSASSAALAELRNGDTLHLRSVVYTFARANALLADSSRQRFLTGWASVDVSGANRHDGYVRMKFLSVNPLTPALAARL
jgi:N-acetylmuramoyl-L-alanine amidase